MSRRLGQDLFDPPNVKGWPGGAEWITADRYLARQELLQTVTNGAPAGDRSADRRSANAERRAGGMAMSGRRAQGMGRHIDRWVQRLPDRWENAPDLIALVVPLPPVDSQNMDQVASGALVLGVAQ